MFLCTTPRQPAAWLALIVMILSFASFSLAAKTDMVCQEACSEYSVVLGHCQARYGNAANGDYDYANAFVGCICSGEEEGKSIGNGTISRDIGICEACPSTVAIIRRDLSTLLRLCGVQQVNGSAEEATHFMPVGYSTTLDPEKQVIEGKKSGALPGLVPPFATPLLLALLGAAPFASGI